RYYPPRLLPVTLASSSIRPPPPSTLFPYTTLFRSHLVEVGELALQPGDLRLQVGQALPGGLVGLLLQHLALDLQLDQPALEAVRSEEHTSELQSRENLVCRLLLEKKKRKKEPIRLQ